MAITHDSTVGYTSSGGTAQGSHTLGSGSGADRIVIAHCICFARKQADSEMVSCTYNSVAGTLVADGDPDPNYVGNIVSNTGNTTHSRVFAFYWLDANLPSTSGSYDIYYESSKGSDTIVICTSIEGAAQQAPEAYAKSGSSTDASTWSTNITTLTADALIIDGNGIRQNQTGDPDSGQTERYDQFVSFLMGLCSTRPAATAQQYTQGWTMNPTTPGYQDYAQYVTAWAPTAVADNAALVGCNF
jgi:hypothetical protein